MFLHKSVTYNEAHKYSHANKKRIQQIFNLNLYDDDDDIVVGGFFLFTVF